LPLNSVGTNRLSSKMAKTTREKVTILFAGDSGDGIQLTGFEFSNTAALFGNDLSTFPDFPAEIRAPQGTVSGVSGFQVNFGSTEIYTSGGMADVLVAMNAAALKKFISHLKPSSLIIANTAGFDQKNLKLAGFIDKVDPLKEQAARHQVIDIDVTRLTREALKDFQLNTKEKDRSKNMFVLGFLYWLFNRELANTEKFLSDKFKELPSLAEANIAVLKAGYNYGITTEAAYSRIEVKPARLPKGTYRNVVGNEGLAIGLIAAARQAALDLFYASYPITPASDILHELARHKNFGVKTFQAEDEIAAATAAIGASFGGALGVTASSGPGLALKAEALGLAVMLELPLVVINVQRGGPSTGLPTKTEQADLFQALYGRSGEAPLPVLAAKSPSDAFETAFEACRLAVEHMTPVILLSDGYIANGAEPWRFPSSKDLPSITPRIAQANASPFLPYRRDQNGVRQWALPGTAGLEHRIGGLEKEHETGNVSYEPENHERMVKQRADKINAIANCIPSQTIDSGAESGELLLLTWGSTYGAAKVAVQTLIQQGMAVSHVHVRYINPLPANLGDILNNFDQVIIPELNNGQFISIIRDNYLLNAKGINKIKGQPFQAEEIVEGVLDLVNHRDAEKAPR
jgi:2-oxoglutarate ferredoxin oxidoreductase subunit alpha